MGFRGMAKLVFFMKIVFRKTVFVRWNIWTMLFFILESVSHIMSDRKLNTVLNH